MNLQPHQQRVVDEKTALDEKLHRLVAFFSGPLFPTLAVAEQSRLRRQAVVMQEYSDVLHERIIAFSQGEPA